ncbi:MAG: HAD hydrolase family protein [Thermoguttaceae bacterium]|nr:HAD hydrolase family protein [Thermoguttaceae bacterium]MDW8036748.1 HAD hydrolase family protein [Thermoguttaceae bacterium]
MDENLSLRSRIERIRALVVDVDGTMTDGGMYYLEGGGEAKRFNVRDGIGIILLRQAGIRVVLASGERLELLERRAKRLQVDAAFFGCRNKAEAIEPWLYRQGIGWQQTACLGDEINDLPLACRCGLVLAVQDANPLFLRHAHHVLASRGGQGAVREAALWLLEYQGRLQTALQAFLAQIGEPPIQF